MKVGDYVRTRDGIISKIEDNFNTTMCISTDRGKYHYEYFDIIKSSPRIIDLIEIGDYVNGGIVKEIGKYYIRMNGTKDLLFQLINKDKIEDIKSIVTKEMFEQMEYKVGEIE